MSRELLLRCSCGSEILAYTVYAAYLDDPEQQWIEVVQTYHPTRLRERIRAFRGLTAAAVVLNPDDVARLRDFLADA